MFTHLKEEEELLPGVLIIVEGGRLAGEWDRAVEIRGDAAPLGGDSRRLLEAFLELLELQLLDIVLPDIRRAPAKSYRILLPPQDCQR